MPEYITLNEQPLATQTLPRQAFIIQTHTLTRAVLEQYRKLERETSARCENWIVYQAETGENIPAALRERTVLCTRANLQAIAPDVKTLIPGYTDLPLLHFFHTHPDYDYYWVSEYDVRFSGDWGILLNAFAPIHADFVATHLWHYSDNPLWHAWGMTHPQEQIPVEERIRCYSPFYRISAAGLRVVIDAIQDGWRGHSETRVPTLIQRAGLTLADFGGDGAYVPAGMKNRFYLGSPVVRNGKLDKGTFRYRPSFFEYGFFKPNLLYHPVKPLPFILRERLKDLIKAFKKWLHPILVPFERKL